MTQLEGFRDSLNRRSLSNFFTIARFGPDTLVIFSVLSVLTAALYYWDFWYLSAAVILALVVLFCIESAETISLSRAKYRQILGAKCLVVQSASSEKRGVVRLFTPEGYLDGELWSTEISRTPVAEGKIATVTGMSSVILEIAG